MRDSPVCVLESKNVLVVSTVIVPIVPSVICAHESLRPRYLCWMIQTQNKIALDTIIKTFRMHGGKLNSENDALRNEYNQIHTDRCRHFASFGVENFDNESFLRWYFGVEIHVKLKSLRWLIGDESQVVAHIPLVAAAVHMGWDLFSAQTKKKHEMNVEINKNRDKRKIWKK